MSTTVQLKPLEFHPLGEEEVHVWSAGLDMPPSTAGRMVGLLSPDECSRAERYYFEKDRLHFIGARALLRILLGWYLEIEPASLRFSYNRHGKPSLASSRQDRDVRFNLAHSHGQAIFGFTMGREIGIDLELVRHDMDVLALAEAYFSEDERDVLRRLSAGERDAAFFRCWTRKEAYIKGRGEGLSVPLDSFSVSLLARQPAALVRHRDDPLEVRRWTIVDVSPQPEVIGAVIVEGHGLSTRVGRLSAASVAPP